MISPGAKKAKRRGRPNDEPTEPASLPTEDDWRRTIEVFFILRSLRSAAARRRAEKLAETLDHEALDVFRVARRLESDLPRVPRSRLLKTKFYAVDLDARLIRAVPYASEMASARDSTMRACATRRL